MAKIPEEKLAEQIISNLDNYWFNPAIVASILANQPLYTQDRLIELITEIVKYQDARFRDEWEAGQTSDGLLMASYLADSIQLKQNPNDSIRDIKPLD